MILAKYLYKGPWLPGLAITFSLAVLSLLLAVNALRLPSVSTIIYSSWIFLLTFLR